MLGPEEIYEKNMAFFKSAYPYIHSLVENTVLNSLTLYKNENGVDVHSGNHFFYDGNAEVYANREINDFLATIDYGKNMLGLQPHGSHAFKANRFFSKRISSLYNRLQVPATDTYKVPDFFPLVVITGIGCGYHIKKLVEEREIISLVIYETNPEELKLSCYMIDWEEIFSKFNGFGKSIHIICADIKLAENQYAILWNHLIEQTPSFALATFFLNHRRQDKFTKVIKRIQKDLKVYLNLWGYYDDEANQMNNAIHNLMRGSKVLPKKKENHYDIPVFIIGSGPSLDKKIETIKKYKNQAILISSGTALRSLYKYGVKPDFQVEIESHYEPFNVISEIKDQEYLDGIQLIGAAQLTPKLINLFKETTLFVKDSTSIFYLTESITDKVTGTTPTCTNTAFAIANYFNFENIYFFGTDYGFRDKNNHHSKTSIYYSDNRSKMVEESTQYQDHQLIKVEDVNGEPIFTTLMYNASRRRIESDLKFFSKHHNISVYNCADGAKIEGTTHLNEIIIENLNFNKESIIEDLLSGSKSLDKNQLKHKIDNMISEIESIVDEVKRISKTGNVDLKDHYKNITVVGQYLSYELEKYGPLKFFVRGAMWHFLHAGASIALKLQDDEANLKKAIHDWEDTFFGFLEDIPKHLKLLTEKPYDDSDPWIHVSIEDQTLEDYF